MADDQTPEQSGGDQSTTDQSTTGQSTTTGQDQRGQEAAPAKKSTRKRATKKAAASDPPPPRDDASADEPAPAKKTTRKRATKKAAAAPASPEVGASEQAGSSVAQQDEQESGHDASSPAAPTVLFQPPPATPAPARRRAAKRTETDEESPQGPSKGADKGGKGAGKAAADKADRGSDETSDKVSDGAAEKDDQDQQDQQDGQDESGSEDGGSRRRRRRGGRRRRGRGGEEGTSRDGDDGDDGDARDDRDDRDAASGHGDQVQESGDDPAPDSGDEGSQGAEDAEEQSQGTSRRRRRRRRGGQNGAGEDDGEGASRSARSAEDEITSFSGSTRLEAKKQRRREGREAGRRRAPVITEAEFLARRESVDRSMVVRQRDDLTQIAVLEDDVLVEHYVARESQTSLIGNVYLGRVQNVLPSMEAAFIDIGRGRNAVLYAGEVNWDALGATGTSNKERKIEQVLKPGQPVLVQVTKDPVGHKGARLTSQISLPGRFLVYVPEGSTSGISRKLPDNERSRLKALLKEIVPAEAGVIVRTAAEGAAEEELRRDVARLTARWEDIQAKVEKGNAPQELYSEPDLTLKVVRDLFTEDINRLVVSGDEAWEMVHSYVEQVAPDLADRLDKHEDDETDAFAAYRIDEQIAKALERKVWLPSGGSLIIDRTEAMTVVDVNTGKFTGAGGNLEETVTKNNLEAAEEIVRQLRLRDIGGIIVIDFIDMVLESNRDLVLRRLIECLGRDRTRHQVAEVTSLGLVQMTRKRIGTGLLEAFSEPCEHCNGRGVHVHAEPVEPKKRQDDDSRRGRRSRRGRSEDQGSGKGKNGGSGNGKEPQEGQPEQSGGRRPTPAEFAAMAAHRPSDEATEASADGSPDAGTDADAGAEVSAEEQARPEVAQEGESPAEQPEATAPEAAPEEPTGQSTTESTESTEEVSEEGEKTSPAPVDGKPRIVTSTRRRGATRAAGPPRQEATSDGHP